MQALAMLLLAPFIILNVFGALIGGVWLAILGEWRLVLAGIVYMAVGAFGVGLLMLPSMALAAPAMAAVNRRQLVLATVLAIPSVAWTYVVLATACVVVFGLFAQGVSSDNLWPLMLWGYGVTIAPWSFLASKDSEAGNDNANLPLFFAQLGTLAMIVAVVIDIGDVTFERLAWWFSPFLALAFIVQIIVLVGASRSEIEF